MKLVVLIAALCVASCYGRTVVIGGKNVSATAAPAPDADPKLCPQCVNFMIDAMTILIDAIGNGGILGNCNDLCGLLPRRPEFVFCDALCYYVGIEALVWALNKTDPDPVFLCEEVDVCPIAKNATGNITSASVVPQTGTIGTTFEFTMVINITSALGTGIGDLTIQPPGKNLPFSFDYLLIGYPVGSYTIPFKVQAEDSETENWPVGNYTATLSICEGFCGSTHKNQYIIDHKDVTFNIIKKR